MIARLVNPSNISGHRTRILWWCGNCKARNAASDRYCRNCETDSIERHAQVASSERAVVYINPATGERRTPARADQPMPEIYKRQGYERQEIMSMTKFEKDTGLVHEATNFTPGSEPLPNDRHEAPKAPKEVINAIIDDWRAANQSGNWTMEQQLVDGPAE